MTLLIVYAFTVLFIIILECTFYFHKKKKNVYWARHQWLIPIILSSWKAEMRRIAVQDRPRQVSKILSQQKLDAMVHTYNPKLYRKLILGGSLFQANSGKNIHETPPHGKKPRHLVHTYHPSYSRKHEIGLLFRLA
jgi:hypothetical protein